MWTARSENGGARRRAALAPTMASRCERCAGRRPPRHPAVVICGSSVGEVLTASAAASGPNQVRQNKHGTAPESKVKTVRRAAQPRQRPRRFWGCPLPACAASRVRRYGHQSQQGGSLQMRLGGRRWPAHKNGGMKVCLVQGSRPAQRHACAARGAPGEAEWRWKTACGRGKGKGRLVAAPG